jgi:hypothetical protein
MLDRHVGRFGAFQDLVDEMRGAPKEIGQWCGVGHEAAVYEGALRSAHHRQPNFHRLVAHGYSVRIEHGAADGQFKEDKGKIVLAGATKDALKAMPKFEYAK